jgi:hypothetical protein
MEASLERTCDVVSWCIPAAAEDPMLSSAATTNDAKSRRFVPTTLNNGQRR